MAQVTKKVRSTLSVNSNSQVVLNNEVPSGWSDFTGAVAHPQQDGVVVKGTRPNRQANQIIAFLAKPGGGAVSADTDVDVLFLLYGEN